MQHDVTGRGQIRFVRINTMYVKSVPLCYLYVRCLYTDITLYIPFIYVCMLIVSLFLLKCSELFRVHFIRQLPLGLVRPDITRTIDNTYVHYYMVQTAN